MYSPRNKRAHAGLLIIVMLSMVLEGLGTKIHLSPTSFTADPSARVFNNKVYVFPSHDILASEGRIGCFCMKIIMHSLDNLTDSKDSRRHRQAKRSTMGKRKTAIACGRLYCIYRNGNNTYFPQHHKIPKRSF